MDLIYSLLAGNKFDTGERMLLIIGFSLIFFPLLIVLWKKMQNRFPWVEFFALLGFAGFSWLSFYFSETKNFGFSETLILTAGIVIVFMFAQARGRMAEISFDILTLIATVSSIFGLYYFMTQFEPRIAGIFFDPLRRAHFFPNAFALFLLMSWPIALLRAHQKKFNVLRLMLFLPIIPALILTYSRGAWIVFIIQVFAILYFAFRGGFGKKFLRFSLLWTIITATVVFSVLIIRAHAFPTKTIAERASMPGIEMQTSVRERLDFFAGAVKLAMEKPILGWGPFSFGYVYRPIQTGLFAISDHPHNFFLKVASENGVIALVFLLIFLGRLCFSTIKKISVPAPDSKVLIFCVSVSTAGAVLHNLIDYNFNFLLNITVFWGLLGLLFSATSHPRIGKSGASVNFQKNAISIIALFIFTLAVREGYIANSLKNDGSDGRETYETSFFTRNFFPGEASNSIGKKDYEEALHALAHQQTLNKHDAYSAFLRAETETLMRNYNDALVWYKKAVELDPKNSFVYYRGVLETARRLKIEENDIEYEIKKLLTEYQPLLAVNAHFTAFTANAEEAALIYDFFRERSKAKEIRELAEKVRKHAIEEQKLTWEHPFSDKKRNIDLNP